MLTPVNLGFPGSSVDKESACNAGDLGSSPGLWRRERLPSSVFWPEEFHGIVHGVTKNWTWLSTCARAHTHTHTHIPLWNHPHMHDMKVFKPFKSFLMSCFNFSLLHLHKLLKQPLISFLWLWIILPFLEFYINGITKYVLFCDFFHSAQLIWKSSMLFESTAHFFLLLLFHYTNIWQNIYPLTYW